MSEGPQRSAAYWIRWVGLLPIVGMVFLVTGIAGAMGMMVLGLHDSLMWVGVPCAFTWVLATYLVAPDRKLIAAAVAFVAGAGLAAMMTLSMGRAFGSRAVLEVGLPYLATCVGGLAALGLALKLQVRKMGSLDKAAPWIATALDNLKIKTTETEAAPPEAPAKEEHPMSANWFSKLLKSNWLVRLAVIVVAAIVGFHALLAVVSSFIDIIQQDQQGLFMRWGRYVRTVEPGLVFKIPLVDHILRLNIRERQGYIQHVDAMTQDSVIMRVSLQYTYEIADAKKYRLDIENTDSIIKEFVQGKLRDIVNTTPMADVMNNRGEMNMRITQGLAEMEAAYGVKFRLVQIQGTYPPEEVQAAIKQRMIMEQRTVEAREQATQKQIIADAQLYEQERTTEGERNHIEQIAQARKESVRMLLEELEKSDELGEKYLDYLMTQELKDNSKWIISGGSAPELHIRDE
jgi:regulator of protease activity HflC (stomatin/prohibitin superfamily)